MPSVETLNAWGTSWVVAMSRSLVDASILLALVLAVWLPLRRRVPSHVACVLFLLVLLKAAFPFPVPLPNAVARFAPMRAIDGAVRWGTVPRPATTSPREVTGLAWRAIRSEGMTRNPNLSDPARVPEPRPGPASTASGGSQPAPQAERRVLPAEIQPVAPVLSPAALGMLVWALLVVALAVRLAGVHLSMSRRLAVAVPVGRDSLSVDYPRLCARSALRAEVPLLVTPSVTSPAVWGLCRPVVLVPPGLIESLTPAQLSWVLLHELAHVRRRDTWVVTFQRLVQIAYVFHPGVWVANRLLDVQREFACDDAALAIADEVPRRECGAGFLAVAERASALSRGVSPALGLFGSHMLLRRRLMRILDRRRSPSRRLSPRALTVLIVAAVVVLPYVRAQESGKPQTRSGTDVSAAKSVPRRLLTSVAAAPQKDAPVDRPKVVRVAPADAATDVDPATEIRVRFDRPMDPDRVSLDWGPGEAGFRARGALRYDADAHEFVFPVWLTPGCRHEVTAGAKHPFPGFIFESADHDAAAPFTWSFTTARPAAKPGTPPRVVAVDPPDGSEVALLQPVKVTFDTRMDPNGHGVAEPGPRDPFRPGVTMLGPPDYVPGSHRFTLTLGLPANWNGEVVLRGFRSEEGVEAAPVTLHYRTLRRPVAGSLVPQAGGAAEKGHQVIEEARRARRKLTSVSEVVRTVMVNSINSPDWDQRYVTQGARFRMQGDRAFVGEVDSIMSIPFRVGSDGKECWLLRKDELIVAPFEALGEKNVLFCDPFQAGRDADAARIARERGLVYEGESSLRDGRRFHVFRSVDPGDSSMHSPPTIRVWRVDSTTHLLSSISTLMAVAGRSSHELEFTYTGINEAVPEEQFRPPAAPPRKNLEPLETGYTRRFLNVIDGSNGRMSVRWGMKGPKGTSSSGLN